MKKINLVPLVAMTVGAAAVLTGCSGSGSAPERS